MAYVARKKTSATGVYAFLERQEQVEFGRWESSQRRRVQNGYERQPYPRQARLEDFAAGRPVNVATGEIVGVAAAEAGAPPIAAPGAGSRSVVGPDDSITHTNDDWARLFIEENGL